MLYFTRFVSYVAGQMRFQAKRVWHIFLGEAYLTCNLYILSLASSNNLIKRKYQLRALVLDLRFTYGGVVLRYDTGKQP